jgi:hypothetical protein
MLGLALWSAIEPGLGIIASSLATLRPLVRTFSQTLSSWKSSHGSSRDSANNRDSRSQVNKRNKIKEMQLEKEFVGIGLTTETEVDSIEAMKGNVKQFESLSTVLTPPVLTSQNEKSVERRIRKVSWWRPPSFPTGLMTEFRHATREIQLESGTPRSMTSTGLDVETGSVPSNHSNQ